MGAGSSQNQPDVPPDAIFQVRVSNAGNSCYLDSMLFAMFAMPSSLDSLLSRQQPSSQCSARQKQELQAVISKHFVGRIRAFESVTAEMMGNIRLLCRKCGWEYIGAPDQQQDAGEFYSFLHGVLGGQQIRLTRRTFTGALPDNSDRGHEEHMALLPVPMDVGPGCRDTLNLSSMLDSWFYENVAAGLRRKVSGLEQEVVALNTYSIENVPCLVAVSLKRFDEQLNKTDVRVSFPEHIYLHKYSSRPEWRGSAVMHSVPWSLRSVVCHRGRVANSGHYYAYTRYSKSVNPNSVWLRFDDAGSPCITQHTNVCEDPYAKSECMLFIYELDIDAHTAALIMLQDEEEQRGLFGAYEGMLGFEWGEHVREKGPSSDAGDFSMGEGSSWEGKGQALPNNNNINNNNNNSNNNNTCFLEAVSLPNNPVGSIPGSSGGECESSTNSQQDNREEADVALVGWQGMGSPLVVDKENGKSNLTPREASVVAAIGEGCRGEPTELNLVWVGGGLVAGKGGEFAVTPNGCSVVMPVRDERYDELGCEAWVSEVAIVPSQKGDVHVCVSALGGLCWDSLSSSKVLVLLEPIFNPWETHAESLVSSSSLSCPSAHQQSQARSPAKTGQGEVSAELSLLVPSAILSLQIRESTTSEVAAADARGEQRRAERFRVRLLVPRRV